MTNVPFNTGVRAKVLGYLWGASNPFRHILQSQHLSSTCVKTINYHPVLLHSSDIVTFSGHFVWKYNSAQSLYIGKKEWGWNRAWEILYFRFKYICILLVLTTEILEVMYRRCSGRAMLNLFLSLSSFGFCLKKRLPSRKRVYIMLTPLNSTFI